MGCWRRLFLFVVIFASQGAQQPSALVIDYPLPDWTRTYMADMEKALGDSYSGPAADVRGYIDYVRSSRA